MRERLVETSYDQICESLGLVPEVETACQWMKANPEELSEIVQTYIGLIGRMEEYTEQEKKIITRANELMSQRVERRKSESNLSAAQLLNALEDYRGEVDLKETMTDAFNSESTHFKSAVNQLGKMMYAGHEMFSQGGTPQGGDPESDRVIWGHTQAREDVDPKVLTHFIICHYLARYAAHAYKDVPELQTKDGFLAALIDVVLLEEAKNPGSTQVLDTWMTSRGEGGLGWMVPQYFQIYKEVLGEK
jgi:hypothetical protein